MITVYMVESSPFLPPLIKTVCLTLCKQPQQLAHRHLDEFQGFNALIPCYYIRRLGL
jgi:hypothetical protein